MSGSGSDMQTIPLSSDSDTGDHRPSLDEANRLGSLANGTNIQSFDSDVNPDEEEEKQRLIQSVLELQNTLDDLSVRVDAVKEENMKLKSENQVLGQYIENLMAASSVFQSTDPKPKKK